MIILQGTLITADNVDSALPKDALKHDLQHFVLGQGLVACLFSSRHLTCCLASSE